jgi:hypothetical protein
LRLSGKKRTREAVRSSDVPCSRVPERESIEVVPFLKVAMFICHMGPSLALVQPLPSISILSPSTVHHSPFYPLSFPIFISHRNSTAAKLRSFIPPLLIVLPNSHKLLPLPSPKPSTKNRLHATTFLLPIPTFFTTHTSCLRDPRTSASRPLSCTSPAR